MEEKKVLVESNNVPKKHKENLAVRDLFFEMMNRLDKVILGFVQKAKRLIGFFNSLSQKNDPDNSAVSDIRQAFSHLNLKLLGYASVGLIIFFYSLSGTYIVNPGEVAIVKLFGQVTNNNVGEGIHYRLPWPVSTADIVNISTIRREGIGIMLPEHKSIHSSPEIVQFLTGDMNIIDIQAVAQYRIKDAQAYLYNVSYPPYLLINETIRSAITEIGGNMKVDEILTIGKERLQSLIRSKTQKILDQYQHGLEIVGITLNKVYPPGDVAQAFRDVSDAKQDKEKTINDARGYQNTVIPQARGEANRLFRKAEAYKSDVMNRAGGEANRFESMLAEYKNGEKMYPENETRYRLYMETMEKVMGRVNKYMLDVKEGQKLNLKFFEN
ncbi:MAG: FtsH protease activity modulator HflK [Deltaproteobacteria bacterium]|nr:MAG: FtsH protease activity modulator HflK [Deltaproteobacteria bacterium]